MNVPSIDKALREADRCVKCGLCLPHCPTYRLYADENESPRGRIALAEGLLRDQLAGDKKLADHLYRCLLCRRCETVCPSGVNYSQLLDEARNRLPRPQWTTRLATGSPLGGLLSATAKAIPLPGSTLSALGRALPGQRRAPNPGIYPAIGHPRGRIGLLLGCVTRTQQGNALAAALQLLTRLGYAVEIPGAQQCCGALAQHQGDRDTATQQVAANREAFADVDAVVSIASGCALQLRETRPGLQSFEVMAFLHQAMAQNGHLNFLPLEASIALHSPCTEVNGLRQDGLVLSMLERIPGLKIVRLGQAGSCCGAAGDHLLTQREQAVRLRKPLLEQLQALHPDYLLSSNIGCALHLAEGARSQGMQVQTLHPVELLARQLRVEDKQAAAARI